MKKLKVLVVPVEGPCELREINDDFEAMHEVVGGWIAAWRLTEDILCVVNEEGKLPHVNLPPCRTITRSNGQGVMVTETLAGQFFVCRQRGADWVSLRDDEAETWRIVFDASKNITLVWCI